VVRNGVLVLAALAALAGACVGIRGIRLLECGLRGGDDPRGPLWVIRGLRGIIVWVCLTALAVGAVFEQVWLLVFAGLWLAEEIYETGVLALILRAGERDAAPHRPRPGGERTGGRRGSPIAASFARVRRGSSRGGPGREVCEGLGHALDSDSVGDEGGRRGAPPQPRS
jgi:hypothetical protein